mmetsp:Transcript_6012/g.23352  ORF Transcript_6012/g.23352 Transcript_6012/m.23352 type:complete len:261 (+) Transcript_6012:210-992(+)
MASSLSSRFVYEQRAGARVPGVQVRLEVRRHSAASYPRQHDRGGAKHANGSGLFGEHRDSSDARSQWTNVRRRACTDEAVTKIPLRPDAYPIVVQKSTLALLRPKHLIRSRVVDGGAHELSPVRNANAHCRQRKGMHEVGRSVNRIHNPEPLMLVQRLLERLATCVRARRHILFPEQAVRRKVVSDVLLDDLLTLRIDLREQVLVRVLHLLDLGPVRAHCSSEVHSRIPRRLLCHRCDARKHLCGGHASPSSREPFQQRP